MALFMTDQSASAFLTTAKHAPESAPYDSVPAGHLQAVMPRWLACLPEFSAEGGIWLRQWLALAITAIVASLALAAGSAQWLAAALLLPFGGVVAVRALALWTALAPRAEPIQVPAREPDAALPKYTLLVPLFREVEVVAQIITNLNALDYPAGKLQILFITEADDAATQTALRSSHLSANMHIVVVPRGQPQTKPRALNYALARATGDYVVVYDAEDEPDRDQLRRASAAFRRGGDRIGCLQARLAIYDAERSWLCRQFAIEYAALFGLILPALDRCRLPIPLGGTSNHFPRHVLEAVGGWDSFNVTEDADLGLRLARCGWQVGTLASTTREEAPASFRAWMNQRRRWLKGWMQTAFVITRQPVRLWRELGTWRFVAVHILLASMLLSAFLHPLYLAALAWSAAVGDWAHATPIWWIGLGTFIAGYAVSIAVAALAAAGSDQRNVLLPHVCVLPLYWLLISLAAYAALWEYATRPFHWNKTPHQGRQGSVVQRNPEPTRVAT
jgi:cellulose synthase/poly-beta-1,6-N-acetylglucosamine synthase-like glycosyltransferase